MLTGTARTRAIPAAVLSAVLLAAAACTSASSALVSGAARLADAPGQQAPCRLSMANLPAAADFPSFTEYWTIRHLNFPGRPRLSGPPPPLQMEHICGTVAGFLTDISLTGKYREENNAWARSLGYAIGKWPYTPFSGSIVGQQRHKALEIYVSLLQSTSARAAMAYADPIGPTITGGLAFRLRPHPLHVLRLPGVVAFAQPLGTNPAQDEMDITVRLPFRNFVLVLGLRGGESFSWTDATPFWKRAYAKTVPLLGGKRS